MGALNWIINFVPVIAVVVGWVKKLFSIKLMAFLLLKATIFFLAYKYMPALFGRFYQWIYDLGALQNVNVDLASLSQIAGVDFPAITGLAAWLFYVFKLDVCFRIYITSYIVHLSIKPLPFLGK